MPLPASPSLTSADSSSPIAGSVLPIQRAEELLATLPGVISARIVSSISGSVDEIHLLTTDDVTPKQTVRNVESALIAHLGMRVSHKKISVAMSADGRKYERNGNGEMQLQTPSASSPAIPTPPAASVAQAAPVTAAAAAPVASPKAVEVSSLAITSGATSGPMGRRRYQFEDVELRRSRAHGLACRVTLRRGEQSYIGEADGSENEKLRTELAARATLSAIKKAEGEERVVALEGCKTIEAFAREFVFVGVVTRYGRESVLMTGSAEVKESPETASVLAVLDATNRWLENPGPGPK